MRERRCLAYDITINVQEGEEWGRLMPMVALWAILAWTVSWDLAKEQSLGNIWWQLLEAAKFGCVSYASVSNWKAHILEEGLRLSHLFVISKPGSNTDQGQPEPPSTEICGGNQQTLETSSESPIRRSCTFSSLPFHISELPAVRWANKRPKLLVWRRKRTSVLDSGIWQNICLEKWREASPWDPYFFKT